LYFICNFYCLSSIKQNRVIKQLEREKHRAKTISKSSPGTAADAELITAKENDIVTAIEHNANKDIVVAKAVEKSSTKDNEVDKTAGENKLKNNVTQEERITQDTAMTAVQQSKNSETPTVRDPRFRLPKPADFDDFWYKGDDGTMYNEYEDDLEEGYYYADGNYNEDMTSTEAVNSNKVPLGGLPRPADYEDFWYEGEDGQMYNEYDDELEEGQFYEEPVTAKLGNGTAGQISAIKDNKETKQREKEVDDKSKKVEDGAAEAAKAAEEAAKAAAEASKNLLKGMSSLGGGLLGSIKSENKQSQQAGFGFGLGGLFGSSGEPDKKQPATAAKASQIKLVQPVQAATVNVTAQKQPTAAQKQPDAGAKLLAAAPKSQEAGQEQQVDAAQGDQIKHAEQPAASKAVPTAANDALPTTAANTDSELLNKNITLLAKETTESRKVANATITEDKEEKETPVTKRLQCTQGFSARQRWKWSYALVKKVNMRLGKEKQFRNRFSFPPPTGQRLLNGSHLNFVYYDNFSS